MRLNVKENLMAEKYQRKTLAATAYLPPEIHKKFRTLAERQERTLAHHLRVLITNEVNNEQKRKDLL